VLPAIYNIGNFYSSGTGGVEQSDKKAYHYYFAAAQVLATATYLALT
jgi:TPR repeat protein